MSLCTGLHRVHALAPERVASCFENLALVTGLITGEHPEKEDARFCSACMSACENGRKIQFSCGHCICSDCASPHKELLKQQDEPECLICQQALPSVDLLNLPALLQDLAYIEPSSKFRVVMELVAADTSTDSWIVFAESLRTLQILQRYLQLQQTAGHIHNTFTILLLTGELSEVERAQVLNQFNEPDRRVLLLANKLVGGFGLNLVKANRCIIMDFGWNPAWDQQAIGRLFRVTQHKNVHVHKLVAKFMPFDNEEKRKEWENFVKEVEFNGPSEKSELQEKLIKMDETIDEIVLQKQKVSHCK